MNCPGCREKMILPVADNPGIAQGQAHPGNVLTQFGEGHDVAGVEPVCSSKANAWFVKVNANTEVVRISAMTKVMIIDEFVCIYSSITILYYQ